MALDLENGGPHRVDDLKEEIVARQAEVKSLKALNAALYEQNDGLQAAIAPLVAEVKALQAEVAAVKAATTPAPAATA